MLMSSLSRDSKLGAECDSHSFRIHLLAINMPWVKAVRVLRSRFFKELECRASAVLGSGVTMTFKGQRKPLKNEVPKVVQFQAVHELEIPKP